jgi:hypothetical protein
VTVGTTSKAERWRPFLAQAEAGNVQLDPGPWNVDFVNEMITLPYGKHDDQADAVALAFNELTAYVDFGPSVAVVMPNSYTSPVGDPEWRRGYFGKSGIPPASAGPDPAPPRRSIALDGVVE